jgi:hypothetical protein
MTIGADDLFYHSTSPQAAEDAQFLKQFRINCPGFLGETDFEVLSPTSERITFVFESEETYNNYRVTMRETPQWQRRQSYYESITYIPETEIIHSADPAEPTTGSAIAP